MDSFKGFKKVIEDYLTQMAEMDELFAAKFANANKNIDECCNYILQVMKKNAKGGCIGCTDDEIFGLAVHYYEEDTIKDITEMSNVMIVSNQEIELTEEDKENIKQEALKRAIEEKKEELKQKALEKYVNEEVVLTEEEKKEARATAYNKLVEEEKAKIKTASKPKKTSETEKVIQTSLFDSL